MTSWVTEWVAYLKTSRKRLLNKSGLGHNKWHKTLRVDENWGITKLIWLWIIWSERKISSRLIGIVITYWKDKRSLKWEYKLSIINSNIDWVYKCLVSRQNLIIAEWHSRVKSFLVGILWRVEF